MGALDDLLDSETVDDTILQDARRSATRAVRYEKVKGLRVHREENLKALFPETLEPGTAHYASLVDMIRATGGRLRTFKNHAKVVLMGAPERDQWLAIAGSANLSTNPRTEQTVVFNDRDAFEFYRTWFDELFEVRNG